MFLLLFLSHFLITSPSILIIFSSILMQSLFSVVCLELALIIIIDYNFFFCIILSPFAFCFIMSKCFCVKEMPTKKIGRQKSLRSRISFRRAFFWILLTSFSLILFCNNILLSIWYNMKFTCFCIRCPLLYCCFTSFFLDEGLTNKFWGSFFLL